DFRVSLDVSHKDIAIAEVLGAVGSQDVSLVQFEVGTHELAVVVRVDFHDCACHQSVGFSVNSLAGFPVGPFHKAKHGSLLFVNPKLAVGYAVLILHLLICEMGIFDVLDGDGLEPVVIHVEGHTGCFCEVRENGGDFKGFGRSIKPWSMTIGQAMSKGICTKGGNRTLTPEGTRF